MGGQTSLNLAKALSEVNMLGNAIYALYLCNVAFTLICNACEHQLCPAPCSLHAPSYCVILCQLTAACISADKICSTQTFPCDMAKLLRCALPFCLQSGILDKYGVELIGAKLPSINKAEDRELFKQAMVKIGLKTPPSGTISNWSEALEVLDMIGKFPLIIRPAFTLGGTGGGIAYNMDEYQEIINAGLNASVTNQVCLAVHDFDLTVLLSSAAAAAGPRNAAPGLQHGCPSARNAPFTLFCIQAL